MWGPEPSSNFIWLPFPAEAAEPGTCCDLSCVTSSTGTHLLPLTPLGLSFLVRNGDADIRRLMLIKCLFCVYQQLQAWAGLGLSQWEQGPHLATEFSHFLTLSDRSLLQDTCYGPSLSSAWGAALCTLSWFPLLISQPPPAHPAAQWSGWPAGLCPSAERPASLDIPSCLGSCCALEPSSGIPVREGRRGASGSALQHWTVAKVVLLCDPLLPNLRAWGLPSMAGYLAGVHRCPGTGVCSRQSLSWNPMDPLALTPIMGSRYFSSSEDG